ncbi:LysR substrate-binding domain-containing protein, partial [Pseudonocardia pini]|uniref:LysR substrate-binding domain-containing protein n=1 Tax=Pseudonocardia pini TaxID=2758030 RepID=UPI001FE3BA80
GHTQPIIAAVRRGIGVALLSAQAVEPHLAAGSLAEIPLTGEPFEVRFALLHRRDRELTAVQRELFATVRGELRRRNGSAVG